MSGCSEYSGARISWCGCNSVDVLFLEEELIPSQAAASIVGKAVKKQREGLPFWIRVGFRLPINPVIAGC